MERSQPDWDHHLSGSMSSIGWTQNIDSLPLVFSKVIANDTHPTRIGYYVDDLRMASPSLTSKATAWAEIGALIVLGGDVDPTRFIGITCEIVNISETRKAMKYNQRAYAELIVSRFCEESGYDKLPKRALPSINIPLSEFSEEPGVYAGSCSRHIGGLLYYARMTAVHLLRATTFLGRFVTSWSLTTDKLLMQLFCYISCHDEALHLFVDTRDVGEL
jgi:hypothetical protein